MTSPTDKSSGDVSATHVDEAGRRVEKAIAEAITQTTPAVQHDDEYGYPSRREALGVSGCSTTSTVPDIAHRLRRQAVTTHGLLLPVRACEKVVSDRIAAPGATNTGPRGDRLEFAEIAQEIATVSDAAVRFYAADDPPNPTARPWKTLISVELFDRAVPVWFLRCPPTTTGPTGLGSDRAAGIAPDRTHHSHRRPLGVSIPRRCPPAPGRDCAPPSGPEAPWSMLTTPENVRIWV